MHGNTVVYTHHLLLEVIAVLRLDQALFEYVFEYQVFRRRHWTKYLRSGGI
jgi:hypothetical protein